MGQSRRTWDQEETVGGQQVTTGGGIDEGEGKGVWAMVILVTLARPAAWWISGALLCLLSLGLRVTE